MKMYIPKVPAPDWDQCHKTAASSLDIVTTHKVYM